MKNPKLKKAFSLLELSIVVLIVGFLIAATTQSSRIMNYMRLQTARSLTQGSPVNSTPDLLMWLEPSLPESFLPATFIDTTWRPDAPYYFPRSLTLTDELLDGFWMNEWHDINPQLTTKNSISATDAYSATMKRYAINGLPAMYFPGYGGYDTFKTANKVLPKGGQFTAFVVFQFTNNPSDGAVREVFYNGNIASDGFGYIAYGNPNPGQRRVLFGTSANNLNSTLSSTTKPEIATITCCNTTVTLSINGTALTITSPASSYVLPSDVLYIGGDSSNVFEGYLSEFILFERVLTAAEISAINQYLSKKYNIKLG